MDLQEDHRAMHVLASNPRLWKAYLEMAEALRQDGRPGLWFDFGADESMVSIENTLAGSIRYTYHDETSHESGDPLGDHLMDNVGFAFVDEETESQEL